MINATDKKTSSLKTPQQCLKELSTLSARIKITFFSSLIWGILAHLYTFTNKLPNHDDINSLRGYGSGYSSGRWFLAICGDFIKNMFGNYSLPWINGFLTIVLLGISACLFIKLFDIYDTLECILVSGIMITFPTVTCLMNFMFTSYYYGIAILLTFTACYLAIKSKYGFVLALILIGCATGTYQSFFILAAGILLLYLIKDCMSKYTSTKEIFHESFKFLLLLLTALLFYLIVNNLFLHIKQVELTDYQGINQMSVISLPEIWFGIKQTYSQFFQMLCKDYLGITNTAFIRFLLMATILLDFILGILWLLRSQNRFNKLFFILFIILFPASVNGIYIICPRSPYIYALMFYSLILVWILPIILWNGVKNYPVTAKPQLNVIFNWMLTICLGASILYFSRYANSVYLSMDFALTQAESYYTTLVTRIKSVTGYQDDLPVAYLGNIKDKTLYTSTQLFNGITVADGSRAIIGNYSWKKFLKTYLAFSPKEITDTTAFSSMPEVQSMPCYPSDGSICKIDDVIIVKFSD